MSHPGLRYLHPENRLGLFDGSHVNHDLLAFPVETVPAAGERHLTFHNGPTIPAPRVMLVHCGQWWGDGVQLEQFTRDLVEGGYLQPLRDLNYGSGPGSYGGTYYLPWTLPGTVRDSQIKAYLTDALAAGKVPESDNASLYCLLLPQGVHVLFDDEQAGQGSCKAWCGYHSSLTLPNGQPVYYSVQPATDCGPCNGGHSEWDAFTMVLSHEIAEAATDPTGQGWYSDADGSENADIVAWVPLQYGPYTVQGYYTNERGNTMGEYRAAPVPVPNPEPQPQSCRTAALAAVDAQGAIEAERLRGSPRSVIAKARVAAVGDVRARVAQMAEG